jgi:class 3 adenylate cyclase
MAGQTETWTLLFTDLAASATLRSRIGEMAFGAFRRRHDELLRSCVVGHRGEVVKLLGDDVMTAFGGAVDAVDSVEPQQRFQRWQQTDADAAATGVRVGLSIGAAQRERGDLHRVVVVEAARWCAAAPTGRLVRVERVRQVRATHTGPGSPPSGRSSWTAYHPTSLASCSGSAAV